MLPSDLVMMEVVFDVMNMEGWLADVSAKHLQTITIEDCIPWGECGGQAIFRVDGHHPEIVKDIRDHRDVSSVDVDDGLPFSRGTVGMNRCGFIRIIIGSGCFLERAEAAGDGRVRFKVISGSEGSIPDLIADIERLGLVVEMRRLVRVDDSQSVTPRQLELVRAAVRLGYYDLPRRLTVKELAEQMHLAPSTLGEMLRRAERNIILTYLQG
jgi:predicted DNA binding protein